MLRTINPPVFFIHIPKCGGTTVSSSLQPLMAFPTEEMRADMNLPGEGEPPWDLAHPELGDIKINHLPMWAIAEYFPRTWKALTSSSSFVVVRQPRDRFVSAVLQRLREYKDIGASSVSDKAIVEEASRVCDWLAVQDRFCNDEYAHFVRQSEYCEYEGRVIHEGIFPLEMLGSLYAWLHEAHGFPLILPENQRIGRRPRGWLAPVYPVARFAGRTLMTDGLRKALYPLWLNSGVFAPTSSGYHKLNLGKDVEDFVAAYYGRDRVLYDQALQDHAPVPAAPPPARLDKGHAHPTVGE